MLHLGRPGLSLLPAAGRNHRDDFSILLDRDSLRYLAATFDLSLLRTKGAGRDLPVLVAEQAADRLLGVQHHVLEGNVQSVRFKQGVPALRLARLAKHVLDVLAKGGAIILSIVDRSRYVRPPIVRAVTVGDVRIISRGLKPATDLQEQCFVGLVHR